MKAVWRSVALLAPLILTGCFHRAPKVISQTLAPPIEDTPNQPPVPSPSPSELPPVVVSVPTDNTQTTATPKPVEEAPKPHVRHKKPASKQTTQQASNAAETPAVSAIGQLTSGDGSDLRSETDTSIQATERALKSITRPLSDQEKKTAAQIAEFLKQARTALGSGDVEGAHTLALKARVLLGELNK